MPRRFNPFAMVTEDHDIIARLELTPCAALLYHVLLRANPAGRPQEFELKKEFCDKWNYSLKWAKQGLQKLIDLELVEVLRTFSGQGYRLIAWHPNQKTSPTDPKTSIDNLKTSQKQPSNADSLDPLYREERETADKPTHHPVSTDERERAIGTSQISKTPEIDPKAKETIETAGFQFNSTLASIVRSKSLEIILAAVEAAKQYHQRLQTKNKPLRRQPEAILAAAIREEWQPQRGEQGTVIPPEFDEWFRLAQATKLVSMTSAQSDLTGHSPGVLCVYSVSGEWLTYDEMRRLHPLAEIKEIAKKQQDMVFVPSPRLSIKPSQC